LPNDLNEDGRVDLLVYYWGRTPVTFLNHQEKALEAENYLAQELVPTVGQGEEWFTNAATFSDLDGDGHSDLIIGNYFPDNSEILNVKATNIAPMQASMTRAYNGGTNHIFRWTQATTGNNPSVQFEDVAGIFSENIAKIFIPIQYSSLSAKVAEVPITSKYLVKAKKENIFSLDNVTVNFPANTFYDDFYMNFEVKKGELKLHEDIVPAFTNFSITFDDSIAPQKDREKMFIGLINGKKISYYNTKRYKNSFTIYSKYLGDYKLIKDGKPPKIKSDKRIGGKWIGNLNELQFSISDELSGIKSYDGYLNGKWILLEYESKTKKLIHRFSDGIVTEGKNDLKIVITDNVGNSTIFETQFFRSQKP
jgi:hypothetical protein